MMTTPRPRRLAIALPLILLAGAILHADDRYQRPGGGFGRIEGRPDREEVLRGATPYMASRPVDTVGVRPYERHDAVGARTYERRSSAPSAAPRRTIEQYYPGMRSGHCTPSRGSLAGIR